MTQRRDQRRWQIREKPPAFRHDTPGAGVSERTAEKIPGEGNLWAFKVTPQKEIEGKLGCAPETFVVPRTTDQPLSKHKVQLHAAALYEIDSDDISKNLNGGDAPVWCAKLNAFLDFRFGDAWEEWVKNVSEKVKHGKATVDPKTGVVLWERNTSFVCPCVKCKAER